MFLSKLGCFEKIPETMWLPSLRTWQGSGFNNFRKFLKFEFRSCISASPLLTLDPSAPVPWWNTNFLSSILFRLLNSLNLDIFRRNAFNDQIWISLKIAFLQLRFSRFHAKMFFFNFKFRNSNHLHHFWKLLPRVFRASIRCLIFKTALL